MPRDQPLDGLGGPVSRRRQRTGRRGRRRCARERDPLGQLRRQRGETHWSGTYVPRGDAHAWSANGDFGNTFIWPDGSAICGFLKWDEWPAGVSDFDLGLFLSGANVLLASSEEEQGAGGGEPPFEAVCVGQSSGGDLTVVLGDSRVQRALVAATSTS